MLGASGNPQYRNQQAVGSAPSARDSYHGPSDSLPDIAGLPGPIERAIANPRPTSGQDNEKRDLAAQEASALWAFWMVCAAVATFAVTSLGTVLIYQQVKLTREAVDDTGKATKAMERQNEIAVDTAQRQLRAYIVCEGASLRYDANDDPIVSFQIRNTGTTPASELRICSRAQIADEHVDKYRLLFRTAPTPPAATVESSCILGPNLTLTQSTKTLMGTGPREQGSGYRLIFGGVISYRDAFGRRRLTSFRYYFEPTVIPSNGVYSLNICGTGNKAN
jgi:hypothetical protein